MYQSRLPQWNCKNKRVFVRADLNVPIEQGKIINDMRLRATQPTIDALLKQHAIVIVGTHVGRPQGPDASLSTQHLVPWFKSNGYAVVFEKDIDAVRTKTYKPGTLVLLENLRFNPDEQSANRDFAKKLASLAEYYVNDAFGTLHRTDTSIAVLPTLFSGDHRTIGLLVEKELALLSRLLQNPKHPFCAIIGGGKIADKISLIEHMLPVADIIMLCPAIVFTFLKAQGVATGKSLVDEKIVPICTRILSRAQTLNKQIMFPLDYQVAHNTTSGPLSYTQVLSTNDVGISIGPKTIAAWTPIIKRTGTVFFNGAMGFFNRPETLQGMKEIFDVMAQSSGTSVIAGGDSAAEQLGISGISHISTGGGSVLAYLGEQPLPGLTALEG